MAGIRRTVLAVLLAAVLLVGFGSTSNATLTLTFSDGINSFTIADNGAGDSNSALGAVTFVGNVGTNWYLNVSTAVTYPALGTESMPSMDLSTINMSYGAGTLTISASQSGYDVGTVTAGLTADVGGTLAAGAAANFQAVAGPVTTSPLGFVSPPTAFSGTTSGSGYFTAPFSITETAIITHSKAGATSFDFAVAVPEPFTLIFLGSCLLGAGMVSRRFKI